MKVTHNFIDQEDFKKLQGYMIGSFFPWYYNPMVVFDEDPKDYFQFTHFFYNGDNLLKSDFFELLKPILDKIKPLTICRVKANLLTKTNKIIEHGFHTDFINWDGEDATELFGIGKYGSDSYRIFYKNEIPDNIQDKELKRYVKEKI